MFLSSSGSSVILRTVGLDGYIRQKGTSDTLSLLLGTSGIITGHQRLRLLSYKTTCVCKKMWLCHARLYLNLNSRRLSDMGLSKIPMLGVIE